MLYPVGIGSEWWLMFKATLVANYWPVKGLFYFFLGLYVPGKLGLTPDYFDANPVRDRDDVLVHAEAETQGVGWLR